MDEITLLCFMMLLVLGIMIFLGKGYDQGSQTDRERIVYSDGPECDDDEDLAEICSPFAYKLEEEHADTEQPLIEAEEETATTLQSNVSEAKGVKKPSFREVKLNDFVANKTSKVK